MNLWLALEISLREIWAHQFRSFLSMLGIVLGVSSLVATMGLTAGIERGTRATLQQIGGLERFLVVDKLSNAGEPDFWTFSPGRTYQDLRAIRASAPLIAHASAELRQSVALSTGEGEEADFTAWGVLPDHFVINAHVLEAGRFLADYDVEQAHRVVVLGHKVAQRFFPQLPPEQVVGRVILLNRLPYQVIGVFTFYERELDRVRRERGLPPARRMGRWDLFRQKNEAVLLPFTTMFYDFKSGRFPEHTPETVPLDQLVLRVEQLAWFAEAIEQVRAALEVTHRGVDDFEFETRQDWFASMESSMRATRLSGGLIAGISLVVGSIGITNIMLASIAQRVREIGIRRALGARARDIFSQILMESTTIALIGGAIGVGVGAVLMEVLILIAPSENMPEMTLSSVVVSVVFATLAGILSGLYPAFQAAALDPIAALRYE